MRMQPTAADELLTPAEVAAILFVDPKTVTRWARAGKLDAIRTPGGHRRYLRADVMAIMTGDHYSQRPDHLALPTAVESIIGPYVPSDTTYPDEDIAAAVVSEAVATALEAEAEEAAHAVITTAAAVAEAAQKAAAAAARAREARAFAAAEAARSVAGRAVRSALAVQERADAAATQVAVAAARAAQTVNGSTPTGSEVEAARVAVSVAASVRAAADATANDTDVAAASVASAVADAAAEVAQTVSATDLAFESEVTTAAEAMRDLSMATAERVAAETRARAVDVASTARQAAAAVEVPAQRDRDERDSA